MVSFDFFNIGFWYPLSVFNFAKIYLFFRKYSVLYSREQLMGFFKNYILEVHTLPEKIGYFRRCLLNRAKIIILTGLMKKRLMGAGIPESKFWFLLMR